jgi:peptidoglycan/xylan/chitin deacetylase (PgdA/CDA1 family)
MSLPDRTALSLFWERAQGRYSRNAWRFFFRRPFHIKTPVPLISFTFDDFPQSAVRTGGRILRDFGCRGTYYASLGLMGKQAPTGDIFLREDLDRVLEEGHELGCHTFDHHHSWDTPPGIFEQSVVHNQLALKKLYPDASFKTFSYPISPPRPQTKRRINPHFMACRGGGQTFNIGTIDRGYLAAYFLEKTRNNPEQVKALVDRNRHARGWLIFATHDVSNQPTPYGCTPRHFETVVRWAVESGARILPVVQALDVLRASAR